MFLRHFGLMLIAISAVGCSSSHLMMTMPDASPPLEDAGPSVVPHDAGSLPAVDSSHYEWPDAGPPPTPVDAGAEAALTVSLSTNTPPGMVLPRNATGIPFFVFDLTTGASPVSVAGLSIRRIGEGAGSDFLSVYLLDSVSGARLTTGRSINAVTDISTYHPVYFDGVTHAISIPAHSVMSLVIAGDLQDAVPGSLHGFEITDVDAVMTVGDVPVLGSFPVRSNIFTIGSHLAPRLDIRRGSVLPDVHVGDRSAEVANFTLMSSSEIIDIQRIWLLHAGSASPADLNPTAAIVDEDHNPILWLPTWWNEGSLDNFLVIQPPSGLGIGRDTVSVSVFMDINGPPERSIKLYVEYPTDVMAITNPTVSWAPAAVCISHTTTGGCSAPDQGNYDGEYIPADPAFSEVRIR